MKSKLKIVIFYPFFDTKNSFTTTFKNSYHKDKAVNVNMQKPRH